MEKPEPDTGLGQRPFGPTQRVGQELLEEPWIRRAIATLEARPPNEGPDAPAPKKGRGR